MPCPRRLLLLLCLCFSFPGAPAARADEAPGCGVDSQDPRRLVEEGLAIYKAAFALRDPAQARQRYAQALSCYEQAVQLSQNPAKIYHPLGLAYEKLGRDAEAVDAFRRFLAEVPEGERGRGVTQKLRERLRELEPKVGFLRITAPAGRALSLDRRPLGQAPLPREVAAAPGEHTVTADGPPGAVVSGAVRMSVTVQAGETQAVDLERVQPPPLPERLAAPAPAAPARTRLSPRYGLIIAGSVMFGVGYLTAAVAGVACDYRCDPSYVLYIPVVGPFIEAGVYSDPGNDAGIKALFVVQGLVQTTGVALVVIGATVRKRVPVAVLPYTLDRGGGLMAWGRF